MEHYRVGDLVFAVSRFRVWSRSPTIEALDEYLGGEIECID